MTTLFIANCTKQNHDFNFRLPEGKRLVSILIPKGKQERILGELSDTDVQAIVQQHQPYGLIHVDEARKVKGFAGMCYSDRQIPARSMQNLYDHNQEVLEERGVEQRKQAAVVATDSVDRALSRVGETTNAVEVEAIELTDPADQSDRPVLAQGVRVDKSEGGGHRSRKGRNR